MTVLHDRAIGSHWADADVGGLNGTDPARDAGIERDYAALRGAVVAMLRVEFPRLREVDELYQEAWTELLELEARGEEVRSRRALLKHIAWRRAADMTRRRKVELMDPASSPIVAARDRAPLPDEQVQVRLEAERLRLVIDQLDERQAAALKLRFDLHLSAREIRARLGVSPKRLEKIVTEAYKKVLAEVEEPDGRESAWVRRQRSLLLACEVGIASPRQRERARRLVERDATCRAMLREMRATLHQVAVLLPVPVLAEPERHARPLELLLGRLDDLWLDARHLLYRFSGRGLESSAGVESAGVGGAAIGAGATAKIVAFCLAAGGTAALCVNGARLLGPHPDRPARSPAHHERVVEPPRTNVSVVRSGPPVNTPGGGGHKQTSRAARETPASSRRSRPAASPAPDGASEFGVGAIGSGSRNLQPAAAPANGGGEFGP